MSGKGLTKYLKVIKIPSDEKLELSKVPFVKSGVRSNIPYNASPAAKNFTFLISEFPVHATAFFFNPHPEKSDVYL